MTEFNPPPDDSPEAGSSPSPLDELLPGGEATPRIREGLPSSYRMRADSHYVDQLEAGRPAPRRSAPAPTATLGASEVDILTSLSAIASSASMLDEGASGLSRQVATELIRAEAWRSTCVLQASRIVRHGVAPTRRSTHVRSLIGRVVESVDHERRLRGLEVDTVVSVGDGVAVVGQEDILVFVLSGLTLLTIDLASRVRDAAVLIAALPEPAGRVTLAVSQDASAVPESWPSVVVGPGAEHAGTWSTPVGVIALRRVAETYGGSVSTTRFANGSRVLIELPVATRST